MAKKPKSEQEYKGWRIRVYEAMVDDEPSEVVVVKAPESKRRHTVATVAAAKKLVDAEAKKLVEAEAVVA